MEKPNKQKQTSIQEVPVNAKKLHFPSPISRILLFGLPLSGVLLLLSIWLEIYKPKITDEWYKGAILVDSADKVVDPGVKKNLLDSGGLILKQQAKLHPYHARVWFLYGYYFLRNDNWDSCIYAEKKAIELGAGGTVNQVEYKAAELLNYALDRKLSGVHNLDSAIKVLEGAITPNFENNALFKLKGFTYFNYNQNDSCIVYLERFYSKVNNDFDAMRILAYCYYRKGMKEKALYYATEAKKIKPDNPDINSLINQLSIR